jgi:hypothetical protein
MKKVNLIEIVHPKMDLLFLALNPPETSNHNAHYFSNNMSFWNLLLNAGLITKPVRSPLSGDDEVFRSNSINFRTSIFGVTDLCYDIVETNSKFVSITTIDRVSRILNMLQEHKIKNMCIVHSKVGKAFQSIPSLDRNKKYGLIGKIKDTNIYELPFHTGTSIPGNEIIEHYKKLKHTL